MLDKKQGYGQRAVLVFLDGYEGGFSFSFLKGVQGGRVLEERGQGWRMEGKDGRSRGKDGRSRGEDGRSRGEVGELFFLTKRAHR